MVDYLEPQSFNPETQKIGDIILVNGVATHEVIDFTPEEIAEANKPKVQNLNLQQNQELLPTDWYYTRYIETGQEVPLEIKQQRQEIRNKYRNLIQEINNE